MNNKTKSEKFRGLSITSLVTGILAFTASLALVWPGSYSIIDFIFLSENVNMALREYTLFFQISQGFVIGLLVTAIVCGSIDLRRIKAGRYSRKGRGFDIAGIVLGVISPIFPILVFLIMIVIYELSTGSSY